MLDREMGERYVTRGRIMNAAEVLMQDGFSGEEANKRASYLVGAQVERSDFQPRLDPFATDAEARNILADNEMDLAALWLYLKLGAGGEVANRFAAECESGDPGQMREWIERKGYAKQLVCGKLLYEAKILRSYLVF